MGRKESNQTNKQTRPFILEEGTHLYSANGRYDRQQILLPEDNSDEYSQT